MRHPFLIGPVDLQTKANAGQPDIHVSIPCLDPVSGSQRGGQSPLLAGGSARTDRSDPRRATCHPVPGRRGHVGQRPDGCGLRAVGVRCPCCVARHGGCRSAWDVAGRLSHFSVRHGAKPDLPVASVIGMPSISLGRATRIVMLVAVLVTTTPMTAAAAKPSAASPPSAVRLREFKLPTANSGPTAIAVDRNGGIWFTEGLANKIATINRAGHVREYAIPTAGAFPNGITVAPEGTVWFSELYGNKVGRLNTNGTITEYPVDGPMGLAFGPDHNLWIAQAGAGRIARMSPTGQIIAEYPTPSVDSMPCQIVTGPDNAMWFTERNGNKVGRISTSGQITEYSVPLGPIGITVGPDGNLWVALQDAGSIVRVTPAGTVTVLPLDPPGTYGGSTGITVGRDGNLWVAEQFSRHITRVTPSGVVTAFPVPNSPAFVVTDRDGSLWFTEYGANAIGVLKPPRR